MRTTRTHAVALVAGLVAIAAPNAEAGNFSFSVFFPAGCAPPPPSCPPPVCEVWVPAHYETRVEKVWIPGWEERVWVPPVYKIVSNGCLLVRVVCTPGYHKVISHPGHYEYREVRVWVAGRYERVGSTVQATERAPDRPGNRGNGYGRGNGRSASARF